VVLVRRLALLALGLQMVLVVTGAAVRVTGSGLGCPTWPRCTGSSLANTTELGAHGYIEFGNRLLAVVMELVGVALVIAVRRYAKHLTRLALVQALVVPIQAVIGGLLVLSDLTPYVLMLHFLTSYPLVLAAAALVRRVSGPGRPAEPLLHGLAWGAVAATSIVLVLGTVVTGTGPHAGDKKVDRLSFDPREVTQLHADAVFLLTGLVIAIVATAWTSPYRRHAAALLGLIVAQGSLGYWQYFHRSPALAVGVHVALATTVFTAASWLALSTAARPARTAPPTPERARGTATVP
jgi:cytochrome c oxidase assembly protein subunit 15